MRLGGGGNFQNGVSKWVELVSWAGVEIGRWGVCRQGVGFIFPGLSLTGYSCLLCYEDRCACGTLVAFGRFVSQSVICI